MTTHEDIVERAKARVGTVLKDKWHIDRLLGVGGMAVVYAATHRNNKRAALKMLHPWLAADPDISARFLREAYAANSVDHFGVVRMDDDDVTSDGLAFVVMELLEGESIEARCQRLGGRLPAQEVLSLADQLLEVLVAAHAKGIIHRDLKPENLFLTQVGVLKVLDFGIARVRELSDQANVTRTGSVLGTPPFMAPEQARGRSDEIDARTDLWAVGATMFKLLTGRYVHDAATFNEILARSILQPAPSIASVMIQVHPAVAQVVDRALAFEKPDRFPDARAMQTAVREAQAALAQPSLRPPATPEQASAVVAVASTQGTTQENNSVSRTGTSPPRRLVAIGAVSLVVGLGLTFGVVHLNQSGKGPVQSAASAEPSRSTPSSSATAEAGAEPSSVSVEDLPLSKDKNNPTPAVSKPPSPTKSAPTGTATPLSTTPASATPTTTKDPFSRRH